MPAVLPTEAIQAAEAAVANAQRVRQFHRRRTEKNSPQRAEDIEIALTRLRDTMKPLKSAIGRFPYGPQTDLAEANRQKIRDVSRAIQVERRKLWKMRSRQPVF